MSKKHPNELLVGAFLTVGLGLFMLLLFLMGSLDTILTDTAVVEADFSDVQSLQVGDPVYVFGMKVGKVKSMRLLPVEEKQPATVRVVLQMPIDCRKRMRENSRVKIDKSLTGNISVLIQEGDGSLLPEGAHLQGLPASDLAAVTEKVDRVLSAAQGLVSSISSIAAEIEAQGTLSEAVADAGAIIKDVRSEIGPLRDRIRQVLSELQRVIDENRLDLRHTVANLKETTGAAKTFTEKLETTPEAMHRSLAEIEQAGASIKDVIRENRSHIDSILADVRHTATNAANLTAEIKRRPWRLLYRPSEEEIQAMDLYDAAWAYNLGATELNRSLRDLSDQLTRLSGENFTLESLHDAQESVRQSLRKQRKAEEAFWEKLRR